MDERSLYDEDIYAWAEQQAEALRRAAASGHVLSNELDLANLAEEIQDVGKSELRATTSHLTDAFIHLLKAWADPRSRARGHWLTEVAVFLLNARRAYTPSMRRLIDLDDIWREAWPLALGKLYEFGIEPREAPQEACPFHIEELVGPGFDVDGAPDRIRPR